MEPEKLQWNKLAHTEGKIPWKVLDEFIQHLIQKPSSWKELARRYDKISISKEYAGYEELYIPYIFAKAAPKLAKDDKIAMIPFLLERLSEAGWEDSYYMLEAFTAACGCMGPVILPFVIEQIEKEEDTYGAWVFLWSMLKLASETKDKSMKNRIIDYCVKNLEKALNGEINYYDADEAAHILAHLGCTEYTGLLEKIETASSDNLAYPEYREALKILKGQMPPYDIDELWEESQHDLLKHAWKAIQQWHQRQSKNNLDDFETDLDFQFQIVEKLARRFSRSQFSENLEVAYESKFLIVKHILNHAWAHKEASPDKLDESSLKDVLINLLPQKAAITEDEFKSLPETASAMLRWLQKQDILSNGNYLAEKAAEWSEQIIKNGSNRKLWSEGKKICMEAREEGLELEDPEIFRELVLKYNERVDIFADSEDSDYPDYTPNIPVKEHQRKIGRNEPCPCGSGKKYKKCCGRVGLN